MPSRCLPNTFQTPSRHMSNSIQKLAWPILALTCPTLKCPDLTSPDLTSPALTGSAFTYTDLTCPDSGLDLSRLAQSLLNQSWLDQSWLNQSWLDQSWLDQSWLDLSRLDLSRLDPSHTNSSFQTQFRNYAATFFIFPRYLATLDKIFDLAVGGWVVIRSKLMPLHGPTCKIAKLQAGLKFPSCVSLCRAQTFKWDCHFLPGEGYFWLEKYCLQTI